jgi:methyl-accepting chemotaxis protein
LIYPKYQARLNIGTRLGIAFAILILYTVVLAGISISQQRKLHDALQRHDRQAMPTTQMLHVMMDIEALRRHAMRMVLATAPSELGQLQNKLQADHRAVLDDLEEYRKVAAQDQIGVQYEAVATRVQQYLQRTEQVAALAMSGEREAATRTLLGDAQQSLDAPHDNAGVWADQTEAFARQSLEEGDQVYGRGVKIMITLSMLVLLSASWSSIRMTKSITRPLQQAAEQARRVAQGDLTQRLEVTGHDELCQLFTVLNEMTSQLSNLIADVVRSAGSVESTALTLAGNSTELSYRTQQQAAHLRETAASMQQITHLGQSNSEHAAHADRLGSHARELAENGGQVVTQAVGAMSDINKGSSKISNIIGLIDEIAFQTNLLALNAAVEAARAGDQGRGFAVVASEVRALAQRSADAAKQIKGLINESADSVRNGTELVDRTGNALSQIQTSVHEMTHLIKQIADSSHEQAIDARRINQSMLQLDSSTQQYTAWVEQGALAARTLREEADVLAQRAAYFTLEAGAGTRTTPVAADLRRHDDRTIEPPTSPPPPRLLHNGQTKRASVIRPPAAA